MLGKLKSGEDVVDRHNSFYHSSVKDLLPEIFEKISSQKRDFISEEIDMGRIVGKRICVETSTDDEIFFAQRIKRKGLTRFVRNRKPIPTSKVVAILKFNEETNQYILITAFTGSKAEPEPWDKNATPKSTEFWNTHALIMDQSYEIIPGTETEVCPW